MMWRNSGKEKLWLLNIIRGISALLIVLYHYTVQYDKSIGHVMPYAITVPWGCYAVYTFFMLSGFLTIYTYREKTTAIAFLKKRFFRLYPMFWVCMGVTTLYMLLIMPERAPSLKQFVLNLSMVPSFFGEEAVDGVYWTLAKELMFYFGFAIVILLGGMKRNTAWLWSWLGLAVIFSAYCCGSVRLPFQGGVSRFLIPEYIYAFLAGGAVFYLNHSPDWKGKGLMLGYMMICIILCFWMRSLNVAVFFALSLGVLVLCSKEWLNKITASMKWVFKPLLFIADISYVLYLTHQFIGFGIIQMMEKYGMVAEAWVMVPIIHAVILAAILHFGIETKINQKLKKNRR